MRIIELFQKEILLRSRKDIDLRNFPLVIRVTGHDLRDNIFQSFQYGICLCFIRKYGCLIICCQRVLLPGIPLIDR